MIEAPDYLPLGSVVSLKGNEKKMMIIERAVLMNNAEGNPEYYDYGFALFPEGLIGDAVLFGNHDQIDEIHFEGYNNDENQAVIIKIKQELKKLDVPKAHPEPIQAW